MRFVRLRLWLCRDTSAISRRFLLTLCWGFLLGVGLLQPANAAFVGDYALSNFTTTNSAFAVGAATTEDGGLSIILTGSNTGSGLAGTTDLTIAAAGTGLLSFNYSYFSNDAPDYDLAGYLIGSTFLQLASASGQSGTIQVPVTIGQIFGFRVETLDNLGEPGVLTISNFSAPIGSGQGGGGAVPEPSTWSLLLLSGAAVTARRLLQGNRTKKAWLLFLALILLTATPLVHGQQNQTFYAGKNATGELALYRTVNVMQLAQTFPMAMGATTFESRSSERLPKIRKRLHPPLGAAPFAPLSIRGAATLQNLTVISAPATVGFNGLTHSDQRLANNGNQLSLEPPNPSVAVSNGFILEGVNNAIQVYDTTGKALLPKVLSTNELFGLPPALLRSADIYGPFPTDMRVFYDAGINRWFVLQRVQDQDIFGNPLNQSHIYLAVSQTGDPTGNFNIYTADTTNALNPGCPCVADYPQIGADQYGFYIAANEYNTFSQNFIDATIFAISKGALASGAATPTAFKFIIPFMTGYEFAIQPATTPPGASYFLGNAGVEYFASTLGSFSVGDTVAVWAMWNTSSLTTAQPNLTLARISVPTLVYAFPDFATQPPGDRPYGASLNPPGPLPLIDAGDTRAQALSYAGGRLHLTFSTKVSDPGGQNLSGGAYVVLSPTLRANVLGASVLRQDYLLVPNNHLLFPAVAVNAQGRGAIAGTVVGPNWFPSAAYIPLDGTSAPSTVRIAAPGLLPEDGFSGYTGGPFPGLARWGDYASAMIANDGTVWMAAEYIGNLPRTEAANWQTFIMQAIP